MVCGQTLRQVVAQLELSCYDHVNFLTTLLVNGDDDLTWRRTVSLGGVREVMECSDLVNKEVLMRRGEWRDWEDVIRVK